MRVPEIVREASLGLGKLDFWQDSIDRIFEHKPAREPVSIAVYECCKNNPIPKHLLNKLINVRRMEVEFK
jgi:NADH dehydrogenase [ubiquinone] 1 alpha subcomplex assembly factor 6